MASNRFRSTRNVSNRLVSAESRLSFLTRRPTPRKLADNFIFTNNIRRSAIVTPLIATDAVTEEQIADDAVTEDQIQVDAMNGKNITSCNISDSNISNSTIDSCEITNSTFDTIEGANFIVTDAFDMTNGELKQVTITDDSLLEGVDVVLSGVTLEDVFADTITATGSGLSLVGSPVAVNGGFAVTGGTTMTVANGAFGVDAGGSGITAAGGTINMSVGAFTSFTVNNLPLTTRAQYLALLADVNDLADTVADLAAEVDGKASSGHSH
jgi:hypothetical protein